jgi:hypothetical protein
MSYDLNIMGLPTTPRALMQVDNTAIDGPQKLAQRMLVLLFTDETVSTNLGIGTDLPAQNGVNISDLEVIRNVYNLAVTSVKETLFQETDPSVPADEQLKDVQVRVRETGTPGEVEVLLDITTQSDETLTVPVPVTTITEQDNVN